MARLQVFRDDGSDLVDQMFRARAELFHDRLKWNASVDECGHEHDRYGVYIDRRRVLLGHAPSLQKGRVSAESAELG